MISSTAPPPLLFSRLQIHRTSMTSLSIRRDSRDAIFTPTKGSDNSISLEMAGLGGDAAFNRFVADSGWYFPLPWQTVGVLHGRIGYCMRNSWGALPVYEKFYLGGIDTIRGYKYAEISPRDRSPMIASVAINLNSLMPNGASLSIRRPACRGIYSWTAVMSMPAGGLTSAACAPALAPVSAGFRPWVPCELIGL